MLGYIVVLMLAAAVGVGVYWVSMRLIADAPNPDVEEWQGTGQVATEPSPGIPLAPSGSSYIPVTPGHPSWQSRVGGIMGLAVAVGVASVTLALALYEAGSLVARLMSHAANSG
jgi:drug/metabolite transporter (DMT)-like permease